MSDGKTQRFGRLDGTVTKARSKLATVAAGATSVGRRASSGVRDAIDVLERKISSVRGGDGVR